MILALGGLFTFRGSIYVGTGNPVRSLPEEARTHWLTRPFGGELFGIEAAFFWMLLLLSLMLWATPWATVYSQPAEALTRAFRGRGLFRRQKGHRISLQTSHHQGSRRSSRQSAFVITVCFARLLPRPRDGEGGARHPISRFLQTRAKSTKVIGEFGLRDGVSPDDEVERLSRGERQSVEIGRGRIEEPGGNMDEPTNHHSVREREPVNELAIQLKP